MATILKERVDDNGSSERVVPLHHCHLVPTIALGESPELAELVSQYQSRCGSEKDKIKREPCLWSLI